MQNRARVGAGGRSAAARRRRSPRAPRGFALQRVYTGDGNLDETLAVRDRDVVLVPRGYHTVSAPPGYAVPTTNGC